MLLHKTLESWILFLSFLTKMFHFLTPNFPRIFEEMKGLARKHILRKRKDEQDKKEHLKKRSKPEGSLDSLEMESPSWYRRLKHPGRIPQASYPNVRPGMIDTPPTLLFGTAILRQHPLRHGHPEKAVHIKAFSSLQCIFPCTEKREETNDGGRERRSLLVFDKCEILHPRPSLAVGKSTKPKTPRTVLAAQHM